MSIRRENILRAYHHQKPYFLPSGSDVDTCWPSVLNEGRPKGTGAYKDAWGTEWMLLEGQIGAINNEKAPVVLEDVTRWRQCVTFPDPEEYDWAAGAAQDTANWDRENKITNVILICGMWERFYMLCGFERALCNLITEPEATYELLSAIADHRVRYIEKVAEYYKPDKIQVHDDYGSEKSLLFSAEVWRALMKPNLKKIIDACHARGILYEHHSCGYIVPILEDLIELGVDAWNTVQYANNPPALMAQYKDRLTLVGGFNDRVFTDPNATDEDKKQSILKTIREFGETGSWIPRPVPTMPPEYARYLENEIYDYNLPIYQKLGLSFERPAF